MRRHLLLLALAGSTIASAVSPVVAQSAAPSRTPAPPLQINATLMKPAAPAGQPTGMGAAAPQIVVAARSRRGLRTQIWM